MKIKGEGFLSGTGLEYAQKIAIRNAEVFYSLETTIFNFREFASTQEVYKQDTEGDRQKIIALILAVRLLEITEAALVIMKKKGSEKKGVGFIFPMSSKKIRPLC